MHVHMHDGDLFWRIVERMKKYKIGGLRGVIFLKQSCSFKNSVFQYLTNNCDPIHYLTNCAA